MYIFQKFLICSFLFLSIASYAHPHSLFAQENTPAAGNATRFENNGGNNNSVGYYNMDPIQPVAPAYGYGYFGSAPEASNNQIFPDSTQANNLYWDEVQQMEQGQ